MSRRRFLTKVVSVAGLAGSAFTGLSMMLKSSLSKEKKTVDFPLWGDKIPSSDPDYPHLTIVIPENANAEKLPGVLICPGGGYKHLAQHEGIKVAEMLANNGFIAAVVYYRRAPYKHPIPFNDASRAMRLLRSKAIEIGLDSNKIALMGFSAGGHLASTLGTLWNKFPNAEDDLSNQFSNKPNKLILVYPVISMLEKAHQGSINNLLGEKATLEEKTLLSTHLQVSNETPPVFIMHTLEDATVPFENSLWFANACREKGVSLECHFFKRGRHGVGLAENSKFLSTWPNLMLNWLNDDWL